MSDLFPDGFLCQNGFYWLTLSILGCWFQKTRCHFFDHVFSHHFSMIYVDISACEQTRRLKMMAIPMFVIPWNPLKPLPYLWLIWFSRHLEFQNGRHFLYKFANVSACEQRMMAMPMFMKWRITKLQYAHHYTFTDRAVRISKWPPFMSFILNFIWV